jgi:hypothetical protein
VVLLLLIVLLALLGVGGGVAYVQVKKAAPSFNLALKTVQKDPQVIQALGEPIDDASLLPSGNENKDAEHGDATWWFDVKGPQGRARVHAHAICIGANWSLQLLEVTLDKGQTLRLNLDTDPGGPDEAPKWSPK